MTTTSGARFIAEAFKAYGVTHFFHVPVIMPSAVKEMIRLGLSPIVTHGEKSAVYMADGFARVSGRVGACGAQAVGAANLAAGLRDPYLAHSPVLAITGGRAALSKYRGIYQEIEDYPLYAEVTKFNAQIDAAERIPDLLRQAFRCATTGAPGPVHLEFEHHAGYTVDRTIEADLAVMEPAFGHVPAVRSLAIEAQVATALRLLTTAKRPIIVAGGGVRISDAATELLELAQRLLIPVATSLNGRGTLPDSHPLSTGVVGHYSETSANRAVCAADLVFFVGTSTGGLTTCNWTIPPPGTRVIQLDINPEELGRNYPNAVSLQGDAKAVIQQFLAQPSSTAPDRSNWLSQLRVFVDEWHAATEVYCSAVTVPLRPERVCAELSAAIPDDAVIVFDTGHAAAWAAQSFVAKGGKQSVLRAHGSLGWAFPAAIGAKCAVPERPVVCFTGDGGFYYHIAELETAVRYNIPVVVVVNNNSSLNQEAFLWDADPAYAKNWRFQHVNFARVADAFGCAAFRVEKPDQIAGVLQNAIAAGRPAVIDVITDENAISQPPWRPE